MISLLNELACDLVFYSQHDCPNRGNNILITRWFIEQLNNIEQFWDINKLYWWSCWFIDFFMYPYLNFAIFFKFRNHTSTSLIYKPSIDSKLFQFNLFNNSNLFQTNSNRRLFSTVEWFWKEGWEFKPNTRW